MKHIKQTILYNLRRKCIIGAKHTHYDTLKLGFPKHLGKEIENAINELVHDNILLLKPTNYGLQVSLNTQRLSEVDKLIKEALK